MKNSRITILAAGLLAGLLTLTTSCSITRELSKPPLPEESMPRAEKIVVMSFPGSSIKYNRGAFEALGFRTVQSARRDGFTVETMTIPGETERVVLSAKPKSNTWTIEWTTKELSFGQVQRTMEAYHGNPGRNRRGDLVWRFGFDARDELTVTLHRNSAREPVLFIQRRAER